MTTAAGFMRLLLNHFLSVFFAAIFRAEFFTVSLRVFPALLKFHFACRTLFLEKIKHIIYPVRSPIPILGNRQKPKSFLLLTGFI